MMMSLWGDDVPDEPTITSVKTPRPKSELSITSDANMRQYFFGSSVMKHPAKQSIAQLMHLLKRFAVPSGVLVDPFGGSGSAMLACSPVHGGMYVLTCELAPHFLAIQQQAWQHFQCSLEMQDCYDIHPGDYMSLHGDSRMLSGVIAAAGGDDSVADLIITSPSYGGSEAVDKRKKQNSTIAHHGGGNEAKHGYQQITRMKDNGIMQRHGFGKHSQLSAVQHGYRLEDGYKHIDAHRGGSLRRDAYDIADLVVTSPPYHDALTGRNGIDTDKIASIYGSHSQAVISTKYDTTAENIGNQRGNKYLESMQQVWQECAKVLKPGGILCCITRDCVQRGKRVPVGEQNKALLEATGLTFIEVEHWQLTQESFWRILQRRKAVAQGKEPIVIDTEQVWIFQKPEVPA